MQKGKLYLVGLPIGNWEDLSDRTRRYIVEAKNIVIEREEAFEHVWPHVGKVREDANIISIEFESKAGEPTGIPHEQQNAQKILDLLHGGEDVYIVADEGMPGVADPGGFTVHRAISEGIEIISTPGPSVAIAAVAVTGTMHNFTFDSFLPYERKDKIVFLKQRSSLMTPLVLVLRNGTPTDDGGFEFNQEIPEFLEDSIHIFGKDRHAALCYNLTKHNERVVRGTLEYLSQYFKTTERNLMDQITVVIDRPNGGMAI